MCPTTSGDVLILSTKRTFQAHVVGVVTHNGQQDFQRNGRGLTHTKDLIEALATAKRLRVPSRTIYRKDLESGHWLKVLD